MCTNVSVCVCKNYSHTQIKGEALCFLATLLPIVYISIHAHTRTRLSGDAGSVLAGGSTCCRRLWSERRLAGAFFSVETAGGWLILYLKGSGLDSRLVAQRKSIVDVEVTQAAFKQTVGSHLSGIRVCVTWRRRRHSPQFYPPRRGKFPRGSDVPAAEISLLRQPHSRRLPHTYSTFYPLGKTQKSGATKSRDNRRGDFSYRCIGRPSVQGNPSVWAVVGLVRGQSDKTIMFKNGCVWNLFLNYSFTVQTCLWIFEMSLICMLF